MIKVLLTALTLSSCGSEAKFREVHEHHYPKTEEDDTDRHIYVCDYELISQGEGKGYVCREVNKVPGGCG